MHCKVSGIEKAPHVSMMFTTELPVQRRRFVGLELESELEGMENVQ
jgi:hypothetical protein